MRPFGSSNLISGSLLGSVGNSSPSTRRSILFDPAIPPSIIERTTSSTLTGRNVQAAGNSVINGGVKKRKKVINKLKSGLSFVTSGFGGGGVSRNKESVADVFQTMLKLGNHIPITVGAASSPQKEAQSNRNSLATIDISPHGSIDEQFLLIEKILNGQMMLHPAFMLEYEGKSCVYRSDRCFVCIFMSRITQNVISVKFIYKQRLDPQKDYTPITPQSEHMVPRDLKRYLENDNRLPRYIYHYETEEFFLILTETVGHSKSPQELSSIKERIASRVGLDVRWDFEWQEHFLCV